MQYIVTQVMSLIMSLIGPTLIKCISYALQCVTCVMSFHDSSEEWNSISLREKTAMGWRIDDDGEFWLDYL